MKNQLLILLFMTLICPACKQAIKEEPPQPGTFGYDKEFILKHDSSAVILGKSDAQVLVSAKYQAKVFTSTATGDTGRSFGWIHYKAFYGPIDPYMNAYGGENRFWLGPEGGPFSLFFEKGKDQKFDNWHTPPAYDSEAWELVFKDSTHAVLAKDMQLKNFAGSEFKLRVTRKISLLDTRQIERFLPVQVTGSIKAVGYRTENTVTNTGPTEWNKTTGMPCTWILDMFPPSDQTTIVIPFKSGDGSPATTNYFGEIPADRLKAKDSVLYFKADGKQRGKLGVHPARAKSVAGSYDAGNHVLTIILYDVAPLSKYLNQEWRTDKDPFSGDAMNAYNDGPLADGKQMGPFYELESVSSPHFLPLGHSATHWHSVFHFIGNEMDLDYISKKVLGVSIEEIKKAL
ncbi:hypothetical protein KXD93_04980 [Mucilaginibacter sp. BJC16-A38]|uniref:DUF6786 family protein n=1 Tax=Mucilaginibacter phenanthrenivorans TaxID=1234842 RepID=UPI002157CB57|nr:DUF6786 family protein [Mucilaginibacter phenanthrenivorans]MCR8556981.1 hypothetical protein [Mucilaginibacter phenanthrenivorans]